MFNQDIKTGLSVIWNTAHKAHLIIDNQKVTLAKNCILFLTEFHKVDSIEFQKLNVIQFNRPFYCVEEHDDEVGCRGLLFFGASDIPKIIVPKDKLRQFNLLWEIFVMEIEEADTLQIEMLRTLLKRFLILCLRIYKNEHHNLPDDNISVGLIKEYNYLVESHYKTLTKVADYAKLLNKSPKTLSNIFKKYIDKTPLQIIKERRLLEAKRLLLNTKKTIQEIAYDVGYLDVQTFSHFFKSQEKLSPTEFKRLNA